MTTISDPAGYLLLLGITSPFGPRPGLFGDFHSGIDLGMPEGRPVPAVRAGTVVYVTDGTLPPSDINWRQGISVMYDCGDGERWWACHLADKYVRVGDTLLAGEVLGLSGNTGASTAPHLHLERQVPARNPVDPEEELIVLSQEGQDQIRAIVAEEIAKSTAAIGATVAAGFNVTLPVELVRLARGTDPRLAGNDGMFVVGEPIFVTTAGTVSTHG